MGNSLFSEIAGDIYTKCFQLAPGKFGDEPITILAICTQNKEKINGHEYYLELFLSIGTCGGLGFLIGTTFGEVKLDKPSLDVSISDCVAQTIFSPSFPHDIALYLKKEQLFEEWGEKQLQGDSDS